MSIANEPKGLTLLTEAEKEIAKITPYLELKVNGVEDKEGFDQVHKARMEVRTLRTSVEKSRTALKASALEFGRKVDAEAKRITALITPIETHLIEQENIVKREQERLAKIEQEKKDAVIRDRLTKLASFGVHRIASDIADYSDDEFDWFLKDSEKTFLAKKAEEEAERQRQADEAEKNRIEAERLKAEREAQLAEQKRIKAEAEESKRKLDAEREAIEAEQRRQADILAQERREIEAQKQRLEREEFERQAKIKAEAEAKERMERELKEREEAEARRKVEEAKRLEAERLDLEAALRQAELMKTDAQKLGDLAKAIEDINPPHVESDCAKEIVERVFKLLNEAIDICAS